MQAVAVGQNPWKNCMPSFTHEKLVNKLVRNSGTVPDKMAPKAYHNMKKGYGLWKEGYVRDTLVKADVSAYKLLFLSKLV